VSPEEVVTVKTFVWFLLGVAGGFVAAHLVNKDPRGHELLAEVDARIAEFTDRMSDAYREQESRFGGFVDGVKDAASDATSTVKDAASGALGSAKSAAAGAVDAAKDVASDVADKASSTVSDAADAVSSAAKKLTD
jgi:hypothetical protein